MNNATLFRSAFAGTNALRLASAGASALADKGDIETAAGGKRIARK